MLPEEGQFLSSYAMGVGRATLGQATLQLAGFTSLDSGKAFAPRFDPAWRGPTLARAVPAAPGWPKATIGPARLAPSPGGPAGTGAAAVAALRLTTQMGRVASEPSLGRQGSSAMASKRGPATPAAPTRTVAFGTTQPDDGTGFRLRKGASISECAARRALLETLASPEVERRAKAIFDRHDGNRNGRMELDELLDVLVRLQDELALPMPKRSVVERLFQKLDSNGDGSLNFQEFFGLLTTAMRETALGRSSAVSREFFITKHPGDVWASYEQIRQIGEGTFGTAQLCRHRATREERVVKAVKKSRAKLPVEDIEKEILVMRQVDHPHIVRLFEWWEDSATVFLVIEALKGGTLRDVIMEFQSQHRGLKEEWIRSVLRQCLDAMAYCHSNRLIHKDLKDENIMLMKKDDNYSDPFVVIIDLGIAEMFSASDPQGQECGGTPVTMAPEVWKRSFGPKCDVWSLGCVLYEMLAGAMPFMAKTISATPWLRLHKRGPDWSIIKTSPMGKDLCKAMLSYSEAERPSMSECLEHRWFEAERRLLGSVAPSQFLPLQAFHREAVLKRSLLLEIASRLPMGQAQQIVQLFESVDVDSSGTLSLIELKAAFEQLGLTDEALIARSFKAMDVNGDGILSFSEFAAGVLMFFKDLLEDRLHALFEEHDQNHDGLLDAAEATALLSSMSLMLMKGDQEESPESLFNDIMSGGKQHVTYEEFREKFLGPSPAASKA